jgi:thiamine kinase-like enzyme
MSQSSSVHPNQVAVLTAHSVSQIQTVKNNVRSSMTIGIEEVVQNIDVWRGRQIEFHEMAGGITNENFRVIVDGQSYFVSIAGADTEFLAVDRENKYHNTLAAAATGVGPQIIHYLPDCQVMVLEFIKGDTMTRETMSASAMPHRLARSLRQLHAGSKFLKDFNVFRLMEYYLGVIDRHHLSIPHEFGRRMPALRRVETAVSSPAFDSVPCTNDLVPENIIDDGQNLRLVDFDYSGNNHPCCELGSACQELQYDHDQYAELCAAYFGEPSRHLVARMHLFAVMSDIVWTLWGVIQQKISDLDFDFRTYTVGRWERALRLLDSDEFSGWLEDAAKEG